MAKDLVIHLTSEELKNIIVKSVEHVFFEQQPQNDYLTKSEACKFLTCSPSSFTNYINAGHFPKYKIEGKVYVKRVDLVRYIESNRIG
jgi:predicted DNA-binding transcriptional regulator AlpA